MNPVSLTPASGGPVNRKIIWGGIILTVMLAVPVLAALLMEGGLVWSCARKTLATGALPGKIEWRITAMTCRASDVPFYDVALGAESKTISTALTTRGAPAPVEVIRLDEGRIGVRLDKKDGESEGAIIPVRVRRSGSPAERIDLQAKIDRARTP